MPANSHRRSAANTSLLSKKLRREKWVFGATHRQLRHGSGASTHENSSGTKDSSPPTDALSSTIKWPVMPLDPMHEVSYSMFDLARPPSVISRPLTEK